MIYAFYLANSDELLSIVEYEFWQLVWFSRCVTANRRGAQVLSDRVPRSSERYSPEREIGFDAYVFWCLAAYASVVVLSEVGSRPGEMSSSKRAFARETCLHASSGEKS
ncbi:hypothetical protein DEO72_LG5g1564 [Vigna unguiculata]|uniref:Uncharacterized protein n=1 Tax=Vigna unguiculata TaxID=3917 RepID=A0A4D6LWS4_VIGUN|nr:hypothetical protein DEO72_LG5g1564 [Vigna unguiculata]